MKRIAALLFVKISFHSYCRELILRANNELFLIKVSSEFESRVFTIFRFTKNNESRNQRVAGEMFTLQLLGGGEGFGGFGARATRLLDPLAYNGRLEMFVPYVFSLSLSLNIV